LTQALQARGMKRETNLRTAQLVQLISEIGPDIPEIARRLGQYKESVRYRYKERILDRGLAIQAMVDHEKLGLKRVVIIVDFAAEYHPYAETILTAMSELSYVVAFEKVLPSGHYIVHASVPGEFVEEYLSLVKNLDAKGFFRLMTTCTLDWFRNAPMQAQFYDFETGRWDFDWSSHHSQASVAAANYLPSEKTGFDHLDLLLVKELWLDATRPMAEISKKLNTNYKKLVWHYRTHVIPSQLIKGYTLRWPGTRYDFKLDRALHRQHRYFPIDVLVTDISEEERMSLMAKIHRLPFLWSEAGGRSYFAQLAFPVDFITEALQYLEGVTSGFGGRAQMYLPDQTHSLAFTIGYKLYDEKLGKWTFDPANVARGFEQLMLRVKERNGESA